MSAWRNEARRAIAEAIKATSPGEKVQKRGKQGDLFALSEHELEDLGDE